MSGESAAKFVLYLFAGILFLVGSAIVTVWEALRTKRKEEGTNEVES